MTDVLIIGAGPVGLAAAIKLSERDVRVRIVDASTENHKLTKASGLQIRTLELLPFEVLEKYKSEAINIMHTQLNEQRKNGKLETLIEIDMDGYSDSCCEGILSQEQWRTEKGLVDYLEKKYKVKVERGTKVVALENCHDFVLAELHHTGIKTERINVKWVIGCDGAHSFTRKSLGITFPGTIHESNFVALHASFDGIPEEYTKVPKMLVSFSFSTKGSSTGMAFAMPIPNDYPRSFLLVADLSEDETDAFSSGRVNKHGRKLLRELSSEEAFSIFDGRWFEKGKLSMISDSVKWCTTFTVNSRQASTYRSGRIFLAGDAAHCHSPLGGKYI